MLNFDVSMAYRLLQITRFLSKISIAEGTVKKLLSPTTTNCIPLKRPMCVVGNKLIHPPIKVFGVEGRYAIALYSAAIKQKALDQVEKDLLKIQEIMKSDKKFKDFVLDPTIKRLDKASTLKKISEALGLTLYVTNMLMILAENGRLKKLEAAIKAFGIIMSAHRGEVSCEITSAAPLTETQYSTIQTVLKSFVKSNEVIIVQTKIDPSIIGGLIVVIGDKFIDMSVSHKIKKYCSILGSVM